MGRLIDDEVAVNALTILADKMDESGASVIRQAIEVLRAIEAYPEQPKVGRWIPCKEKLPQEDESVLVTGCGGRQHVWNITRTVAEYLGGLCWEDDYGYYQDLDDAVAWQPLPEPYNEEDDNCGVRKEGQNVDAFT